MDYVLHRIDKETGGAKTISGEAKDVLMNYSWPGNVREMIGTIRRAAIMCDGDVITVDDLPLHLRGGLALTGQAYSDKSLDDAISELEKGMIVDALKRSQGSQAKAAKLLGISERSIWYRVKKYDIVTDMR